MSFGGKKKLILVGEILSFRIICLSFFLVEFFLALSYFRNIQKKACFIAKENLWQKINMIFVTLHLTLLKEHSPWSCRDHRPQVPRRSRRLIHTGLVSGGRSQEGLKNARSGHQLNYILLAIHNQGPVWKRWISHRHLFNVWVRFSWRCPVTSATSVTHLMVLLYLWSSREM